MASSYTPILGLVLPATGDLNGTWGTTVNSQLTQLVEDSLAGYATASVTAGDWTLSTTGSGATNEARMMVLIPTGAPGVARSIFAPKQSKVYIVINRSTLPVTVKGGPTTPTAGVTINAGQYAFVAWDTNTGDFIVAGIGNNGTWSINTSGTANVAGGSAGAIPYQFATNQTSVLAAGTSGQVFLSGGAGAPSWANPGSLSVGTATNLAGGLGGQIPYQTAAGATAMLANGTAGQVLTSAGGTAAPTWASTTGVAYSVQTFTASGTWTKPAGGTMAIIEAWGGGGSGSSSSSGAGGGGGNYNRRFVPLSSLGATETVTIGAGGASVTNALGNAGGTTTFGAWLSAAGGDGGGLIVGGSGGGGRAGASINGFGRYGGGSSGYGDGVNPPTVQAIPASEWGGGAGALIYTTNTGVNGVNAPQSVLYGGGGGASSTLSVAGGASVYGGAGGASPVTPGVGGAGSAPGGGGSSSYGSGYASGAGGAGKVIVTVF